MRTIVASVCGWLGQAHAPANPGVAELRCEKGRAPNANPQSHNPPQEANPLQSAILRVLPGGPTWPTCPLPPTWPTRPSPHPSPPTHPPHPTHLTHPTHPPHPPSAGFALEPSPSQLWLRAPDTKSYVHDSVLPPNSCTVRNQVAKGHCHDNCLEPVAICGGEGESKRHCHSSVSNRDSRECVSS